MAAFFSSFLTRSPLRTGFSPTKKKNEARFLSGSSPCAIFLLFRFFLANHPLTARDRIPFAGSACQMLPEECGLLQPFSEVPWDSSADGPLSLQFPRA